MMESFIMELFMLQSVGLPQRNLIQSCGYTVEPALYNILQSLFIYTKLRRNCQQKCRYESIHARAFEFTFKLSFYFIFSFILRITKCSDYLGFRLQHSD